MILNPGDIAADYVAKKNPAALIAAGVRLVVRYDSPNANHPKNLTVDERDALQAGGLSILVVFEAKNIDPLQGATLGAQHGAIHESHLAFYQYPGDIVSIVAVDFDTTLPQIETILDYIRAFNDNTSRPLWVYGEADLIDTAVLRGVAVGGWQTVAWSHHQISPHAFCLQHATPVHEKVAALGAIDDNTVLQTFRAWSTFDSDTSTGSTNIGDTDMAIISNKTAGKYGAAPSPQGGCTIWELVRDGLRYYKNALSFPEWVALGMPFGVATDDATLDQIPDYAAPAAAPAPSVAQLPKATVTSTLNWDPA